MAPIPADILSPDLSITSFSLKPKRPTLQFIRPSRRCLSASRHMLAPKWVSYASTGQGPASASDASWVVGNFYWAFERAAWGSVEHLSAGIQRAGGRVWELWASTRGALGEQEEPKQSASRGLGAPFTGHRGCWIRTFGTEGWSYLRHERTNVPSAQNLHGNIK